MSEPLSHLKVLELQGDVATRYCGRLFRQLGAEVVNVGQGDDQRIGYGGEAGEAYGRWLDAGKVSVDDIGGVAADFDLVISGQDRLGVVQGRVVRARLAPGATLLELTWFDLAGPYADWVATDETIAALNGTAFLFGEAEGAPMLAQGHAAQVTAGVVAFNAALAARLYPPGERPSTVSVNVFEAALCYSEVAAMTSRVDGSRAARLGVNRFSPTYPCAAYRTLDGWVGVTCLTPSQWSSLCRLIDRMDLSASPRFATAIARLGLADEVDEILNPYFAARTTAEWVRLGDANRIPIAPMTEPHELPRLPHWVERGAFAPAPGLPVQGPTLPYRLRFDGVTSPRPCTQAETGPLAGLRVADFSMGWAGPLCARTLGDLGADVIKIESEAHPDWWRGWEAGSIDASTREVKHNFLAVNRNKRGVDLDLTQPETLRQVRSLIAGADVVIENFAAGVLEKLGLGPSAQRQLRPGVISLSMPAFGNGGPLSGLRAYGSTVEQASGLPFINGEGHWPPSNQHVAYGDPIAGLYAAGAILAALAARERLGGAEIDMSQVACLFQLGADGIIAAQTGPSPLPRTGRWRRRLALCSVVRARDGWLTVAAERYAAAAVFDLVGGTSEADLALWAAEQSAADATAALQAAGVPAAPVRPAEVLSHDPQLITSGFWCHMDRAYVGRHLMCGAPYRFDGIRPEPRRAAPTLGEHTSEVLAELSI